MSKWPEPDPHVAQSFIPSSPVGDRWQNRMKSSVYPSFLRLRTALAGVRRGVAGLKPPLTWGFRGSEFDYVISQLGESQIRGKRVLFQGMGNGQECRFWEPYGPRQIVGVDLSFDVSREATTSGFPVSVAVADLVSTPFADNTFEGIASINTWEHIKDIQGAFSETCRLASPGGWFLATFGPLYKAVGGDHLGRLRGGLAHAYNQILLDPEEYLDFIDHMSIDGVEMIDGVSAGARLYIELDLFSHASWRDYFELFSATLDLGIFTVHVNPEAVEFRDRFPEKWAAILRKGHAETDLLASSITVLGFFE